MTNQNNEAFRVYIGTYTIRKDQVRSGSEGIYVYHMDPSSGALKYASVANGGENPSFLAIHPEARYLYAVNELAPDGAVTVFSIDPNTGELTYLNQQPSHGGQPCHLSVDKTGRLVLVANYRTGSVSMFPIQNDGKLGEATDVVQHQGSSVNPQRQEGPHAHSINIDAANRYAFAPDLGIDKVMIYQLDLAHGKLKPNDQPSIQVKAGVGPRHFDFHPNRRYAYVINEIGSTITVFAYDETNGTLAEIQTVSTLPEDFEGGSSCADVHVHPSGKYLYGSNRGHDSIVIFEIDDDTGALTYVGHESTQGKMPRNFAINPTGTFLLAANQDTDNIVTFRIDQGTGKLTATGHATEVPMPVCLKLIPIAS